MYFVRYISIQSAKTKVGLLYERYRIKLYIIYGKITKKCARFTKKQRL